MSNQGTINIINKISRNNNFHPVKLAILCKIFSKEVKV